MGEVLVLGNGISRLGKDDVVRSWHGEVWGCNKAYLEFPTILTRLTGHYNVLEEAAAYRDQHPDSKYQIWTGNLGKPLADGGVFDCPPEFRNDSGTTFVAQALYEGLSVAAFGFDLGGYDIHSPNVHKDDKSRWVLRWRAILRHYGSKRIRFIGYDHLPYLLSSASPDLYARDYLARAPHINEAEYISAWESHTGRSAKSVPRGSVMVKVIFPNGYVGQVRENIAVVMIKRGECKLMDEVTPGDPAPMSGDSTGKGRSSSAPRKASAKKDKE